MDFGLNFRGKWRDGENRRVNGGNFVVSYDGTHHSYAIEDQDYDAFLLWVADTFSNDFHQTWHSDYKGGIYAYLDECDIWVDEA